MPSIGLVVFLAHDKTMTQATPSTPTHCTLEKQRSHKTNCYLIEIMIREWADPCGPVCVIIITMTSGTFP